MVTHLLSPEPPPEAPSSIAHSFSLPYFAVCSCSEIGGFPSISVLVLNHENGQRSCASSIGRSGMVLPVSGTAELPHAEESGKGNETGTGDRLEGAEAAVRSLPGFATQRKGPRTGHDGDRKGTERFCLGDCLRRYGRTDDEVEREAMNRMHALRAPLFTKLWAMDEGGLVSVSPC